jgi:hypothetical protein
LEFNLAGNLVGGGLAAVEQRRVGALSIYSLSGGELQHAERAQENESKPLQGL